MAATLNVAEGEIIAGKYRVEKVLGRGGMGVVVAATHLSLGHKVAIKLLLPGATPEIIARFAREARASVRLKSEHVARVLDVGELPSGTPYMVMEYLEGNDLSRVLRKRGAFPITDAGLGQVAVAPFGDGFAVAVVDAIDPSAPTLRLAVFSAEGLVQAQTSFSTGGAWLTNDRLTLLGAPDGKALLVGWVGASPDLGASLFLRRFDCADLG